MMDPMAMLYATDRIILDDLAKLGRSARRAINNVDTLVAQFDRLLNVVDDQQRLIGKLSEDIQELEQRIQRLESER